jgi:hypothetical protein
VTPEERRLLEATARSVLKIKEDILDRMTGVETVLHAIFLAKGTRHRLGTTPRVS